MQKLAIKKIIGRKILDSRGNPTIEVEVYAEEGKKTASGQAAAPSGASKGSYEVVDLPAGGVDEAVAKVGKILPRLAGVDAFDQAKIDETLHEIDGTPNLAELGGNTTVAISMAVAKAAAAAKEVPLFRYLGGREACELPFPLGNVIGGGKHAGGYAPDIQEFLAIPVGAKKFKEAVFTNAQVYKKARELIKVVNKTYTGGKGDEGAWAPNLGNEEALELLVRACEEVSAELGVEMRPGLDLAASSFYNDDKKEYVYDRDKLVRDSGEQIEFIADLVKKYKLFYVEDPLQEEDFDGLAELTRKVGKHCIVCGDDIFVTNVERLQIGIKSKAGNAVIIKPNQIGTLTDASKAVELAKRNNYTSVISHRSGETTDNTIAHLAVAWRCPMIKTGVVGGERIAKLNELVRIEEGLVEKAKMGRLR